MVGIEFNNTGNSQDVLDKIDASLPYGSDYDDAKYISHNKAAFGDDGIAYPDHWLPEDKFYPTSYENTTISYSGEEARLNCTEHMAFIMELNKFYAPSQILVPAVYCLICLIGLAGNALVMFVIFGSKEMTKTVANIYIWNLALADTLFLVSLPFASTQRVLLEWPFGVGMCKIVEAVKYLNYFASIFFLTAMSVDRYIAVVYVVSSSKWRTTRNTYFVCAGIWLISLVLIVPLLINTQILGDMCVLVFESPESENVEFNLKEYEDNEMDWGDTDYSSYDEDCDKVSYYNDYTNVDPLTNEYSGGMDFKSSVDDYINDATNNGTEEFKTICKHPESITFYIFIIFTFLIGFVGPFSVITVCYALIIARLRRPSEMKARSRQVVIVTILSLLTAAERTRRKVTRMVVALVITFFICWLPFYIWHLVQIRGVTANIGICHNIRDFTYCLGYSNSFLNPILYTFLGHNFQERLRKSLAISLRSFSFSTFTKYTNTASRMETGAPPSRVKLETSHSENHHHPQSPNKTAKPKCQGKENNAEILCQSSKNCQEEKLLQEKG